MSAVYTDQPRNTTAAYVDGAQVEIMDDNPYAEERAMIERIGNGRRYVERVVFGNGRVALIFTSL